MPTGDTQAGQDAGNAPTEGPTALPPEAEPGESGTAVRRGGVMGRAGADCARPACPGGRDRSSQKASRTKWPSVPPPPPDAARRMPSHDPAGHLAYARCTSGASKRLRGNCLRTRWPLIRWPMVRFTNDIRWLFCLYAAGTSARPGSHTGILRTRFCVSRRKHRLLG